MNIGDVSVGRYHCMEGCVNESNKGSIAVLMHGHCTEEIQ